MVVVRPGGGPDLDPAVAVWQASNTARRGGLPVPAEHEARVRGHAGKPDAFLLVADDGAGPPVPGLCHVSTVFVAPNRWGEGIGGRIVDAVLAEARARGYERAQLWTHADNARAQRLYEGRDFQRSGREKDDDLGERIVHYQRALPP